MIKEFPIIPLIMGAVLTLVIIHGLKVSRENQPKADYSMAAGIDAHLTAAREAFVDEDDYIFHREMNEAIELMRKEANCESCIDKGVAAGSLPSLRRIRDRYDSDLELGDMDRVFGAIITALARNHIVYTLEHLSSSQEDEFYLEDAVRHLKYSMDYQSQKVREKERIAAETLEKALIEHKIDEAKMRQILNDILSDI